MEEEINFHDVPTEILEEEISRRRAVIEYRKVQAQSALTATAKEIGGLTPFGVSRDFTFAYEIFFNLLALCAFFGVFILFRSQGPHRYAGYILGLFALTGLFGHMWLHARNNRIVRGFCVKYPKEAKLLGYMK